MTKLFVDDSSLVSVADAIRTKGNTTEPLTFPNGFVSAIGSIESAYKYRNVLIQTLERSIVEITPDMLDGCTILGMYSYYGCKTVKKVELPEGIQIIYQGAFQRCTGLESVIIPKSIIQIVNYTFYGCTNLTTVEVRATTPPSLMSGVFDEDPNLTSIIVPKGCLSAYQTATNWSAYADLMVEATE